MYIYLLIPIQMTLRQGAEVYSTEEAVRICTGLQGRVSEVAFETFSEERTQNRLQVSLTA